MNTILKRLYQLSEPELINLSEAIDIELQRRADALRRNPGFRPAAGRGASTKLSAAQSVRRPRPSKLPVWASRVRAASFSAPCPTRKSHVFLRRAPR